MLDWIAEPSVVECVVCRRRTHGTTIARRGADPRLDVVACSVCGSLKIVGADGDPIATDGVIDDYLEFGAGVDALLANLFRVGGVRSVLDVGCGFGLAIAYAVFRSGWDAVGVDPGTEARRGAEELGLDIRSEPLRADTRLGRTFDLIIASEVLEHVPDPLGFLVAARAHLSDRGRLVLTTPDAASVTPRRPRAAERAVALGAHLTLYSDRAIAEMLTAAGFGSVVVAPDGDSLVAVAASREGEALSTIASGPSAAELDEYYADLIGRAESSSALGLGMRIRRFTSLVAQGLWESADACEADALAALRSRYDHDLSKPRGVDARRGSGGLLALAHGVALSRLARGREPARVVELFDLCERAADHLRSGEVGLDAGSQSLLDSARRNRTIALARVDPERAPEAARSLLSEFGPEAAAEWVTRTFCELALNGHLAEATRMAVDAQLGLAHLPADAHGVRIAMNTARGLAAISRSKSERWTAIGWIGFEEDLLAERAPGVLTDDEIASRRIALADLRTTVTELADSVDPSETPSITPSDETLLWAAAGPTTAKGKKRAQISVVLSLYNGVRYVERAVRSVVAQTVAPAELIVVDDGSTDGGAEAVAAMVVPFPVVIIRRPNGGQSSARNVGIRAASGAFVAFIDQDDEWRPGHLETLQQALAGDDELAWVFTDFDAVDHDGRTLVRNFVEDTQVQHPRNSVTGVISADIMALPSASLLRRRALLSVQGFDRRLVGYEDDDLFVRLFRRGWTYRHVAKSTVRYRMHVGGASSTALFLRSRLLFLTNLLRSIPDDHRLGLYLSAEYIGPRFFQATIRDYAQALAFQEYDRASVTLRALEHIARIDGSKMSWRRRLGLRLMRNPRRFRRMLAAVERLPRYLRPRLNPDLYLSRSSQVRADRRQRTGRHREV